MVLCQSESFVTGVVFISGACVSVLLKWKVNVLVARLYLTLRLCGLAHQTPLFMGFSRQEYWSELPCPPPGDLPNLVQPESKSYSLLLVLTLLRGLGNLNTYLHSSRSETCGHQSYVLLSTTAINYNWTEGSLPLKIASMKLLGHFITDFRTCG